MTDKKNDQKAERENVTTNVSDAMIHFMRQIGGQTHSYIRHIFDSLRVLTFVFMLIANIAATQRKPAQIAPSIKENPSYLPFGSYPHIHEIVPEPKESDDLGEEIEDLSTKVRSTVKTFAQHRNSNCFGDPCLIQAFPLIYTKKNSGFFGGFPKTPSTFL